MREHEGNRMRSALGPQVNTNSAPRIGQGQQLGRTASGAPLTFGGVTKAGCSRVDLMQLRHQALIQNVPICSWRAVRPCSQRSSGAFNDSCSSRAVVLSSPTSSIRRAREASFSALPMDSSSALLPPAALFRHWPDDHDQRGDPHHTLIEILSWSSARRSLGNLP